MGQEIKESHFTSLIPERHPPRKLSISQNKILVKSDLYFFFIASEQLTIFMSKCYQVF